MNEQRCSPCLGAARAATQAWQVAAGCLALFEVPLTLFRHAHPSSCLAEKVEGSSVHSRSAGRRASLRSGTARPPGDSSR